MWGITVQVETERRFKQRQRDGSRRGGETVQRDRETLQGEADNRFKARQQTLQGVAERKFKERQRSGLRKDKRRFKARWRPFRARKRNCLRQESDASRRDREAA